MERCLPRGRQHEEGIGTSCNLKRNPSSASFYARAPKLPELSSKAPTVTGVYGGLNKTGPLGVALLGGMALLKNVCHWRGGLEVSSYAQALPHTDDSLLLAAWKKIIPSWLPSDQNIELLAPPAPCLPA